MLTTWIVARTCLGSHHTLSSPCWSVSTGPPSNRSCISFDTPCTVASLGLLCSSLTDHGHHDVGPRGSISTSFYSEQPKKVDIPRTRSLQRKEDDHASVRASAGPGSILSAVIAECKHRTTQDDLTSDTAAREEGEQPHDASATQLPLEQLLWPKAADDNDLAAAQCQSRAWTYQTQGAHQLKPATAVAFSASRHPERVRSEKKDRAKPRSALTQLFPEAFTPNSECSGVVAVGWFPHQESRLVREV